MWVRVDAAPDTLASEAPSPLELLEAKEDWAQAHARLDTREAAALWHRVVMGETFTRTGELVGRADGRGKLSRERARQLVGSAAQLVWAIRLDTGRIRKRHQRTEERAAVVRAKVVKKKRLLASKAIDRVGAARKRTFESGVRAKVGPYLRWMGERRKRQRTKDDAAFKSWSKRWHGTRDTLALALVQSGLAALNRRQHAAAVQMCELQQYCDNLPRARGERDAHMWCHRCWGRRLFLELSESNLHPRARYSDIAELRFKGRDYQGPFYDDPFAFCDEDPPELDDIEAPWMHNKD